MPSQPDPRRAEALGLRAQGAAIREIAAMLHVAHGVVYDWLARGRFRLHPPDLGRHDHGEELAGREVAARDQPDLAQLEALGEPLRARLAEPTAQRAIGADVADRRLARRSAVLSAGRSLAPWPGSPSGPARRSQRLELSNW